MLKPGRYEVLQLEKEGYLLVQDGNHGEYRPLQNEFATTGVPFIRPDDLVHGDIDFVGCDFINDIAFQRIRKGIGKADDTLLTHRATVGRVARAPLNAPTFVTNPGVTFWRSLNPKVIDPNYLHAFIRSNDFMSQLWRLAGDTDIFPYVSLNQQRSMFLDLPTIEVQKRIGGIVQAFDQKLRINRLTIQTLEEMAKTLFKEWFIDFGPVRAKAEGKNIFAMEAETAALFPDSFEEAEIGLIPRGWEVKSIDKVANYLNGLALQKFPPVGTNDLPVVKIAQLRANSTKGADLANNNVPPDYILNDGDIIFSWSGTLEVKIWTGGKGALNQHLFKVTSNNYPKWFYWLATLSHLDFFREVAASKATTMGHIQRSHLTEAKVACPPANVFEKANGYFLPIFEKIVLLSVESKNLEQMRDLLLPKLISGEIDLKEVSV